MKRIFASFAAISALLASCTKDYSGTEPYDPSNPSTKYATFILEGASAGSSVALLASGGGVSELSYSPLMGDNCFSGSFTEAGKYYFLQPFSAAGALSDETLEVSVPNVQAAVEGSFDTDAFFRIGRGASYSCSLTPLSRKVTFTLALDDELDGITLKTASGAALQERRSCISIPTNPSPETSSRRRSFLSICRSLPAARTVSSSQPETFPMVFLSRLSASRTDARR